MFAEAYAEIVHWDVNRKSVNSLYCKDYIVKTKVIY